MARDHDRPWGGPRDGMPDGRWLPSPPAMLVFVLLAVAPLCLAMVPPATLHGTAAGEIHVVTPWTRPGPARIFPRAIATGPAYPCTTRPADPAPAR